MFNRLRPTFCPILVLSFGLCSCHPPSQTPASEFRIAEPEWRLKDQSTMKFAPANDHLMSHDLSDSLSFSDDPSGPLNIRARCLDRSSIIASEAMFKIPADIPVYAMLPKALLAPREPGTPPIRCSFDFHALRGDGSSHHFQMQEATITDGGWSDAVEFPSNPSPFLEDQFDKIRFRVMRGTTAVWICQGSDASAAISSNRTVTLADFEFGESIALRKRPLQQCRIVGMEAGVATALSAPFTASFHSPVPDITATPVREAPVAASLLTVQLRLFQFHMVNTEPFTLRLHLQKPGPGQVLALGFNSAHAAALQTGSARSLCTEGIPQSNLPTFVFATPQTGITLIDEPDFFQIELPPDASLDGWLQSRLPYRLDLKGYYFQIRQPFVLETFQLQGTDWIKTDTRPWNIESPMWYAVVPVKAAEESLTECHM